MAETEASEKIENKSSNGQSSIHRSIKIVSRKTERAQVNICDFNLLQIPPKIDINFIIQEIIVPRLPDGYTIALSEPKSRPNSTVFSSVELQQKENRIVSTKDFLIPTNSPRQLHPKRKLKFDVKIVERVAIEQNSDRESKCEYLFSQLLQDLDDLCDKQQPLIEKQMDEISENLSVSVTDEQGSDQPEPDDSTFKADEFTWNISRRETVPEVIEPVVEESDDEFDESNEDDDDE